MKSFAWIAAAGLGVLLSVPGSAGQGQGKGQAKGHAKSKSEMQGDNYREQSKGLHRDNDNELKNRKKTVKAFGKKDRDIIVGYFHELPGGLPPGLAKRDTLPPGLEKQLRRNGRLPPGLEKEIEPFPLGLSADLPPLMPGYKRGFLHGRALIYQPGGLIVDVISTF